MNSHIKLYKSFPPLLLFIVVSVFLFVLIKLTGLLSLIDNDDNCIKNISSEYSWNYCDKCLLRRTKDENLFVVIKSSRVDSILFEDKNEFVAFIGGISFNAIVQNDSLILNNKGNNK
jgi:hypothetical protein